METSSAGLLSKSAAAYEHLRRLAMRGELRPARRLSPPDLAALLRISVTPVRDALAKLAAEGFIEGSDGRGYFTKAFSSAEHLDLERLLTAGLILGLHPDFGGSRRLGPGAGEALPRAFVLTSDPSAAAEAIGETFQAIIAGADGSVLRRATTNLVDRTLRLRSLDLEDPAALKAERSFLREVIERLRDGKLDETTSTVRSRLDGLAARLPDLVQRANATASRSKFP